MRYVKMYGLYVIGQAMFPLGAVREGDKVASMLQHLCLAKAAFYHAAADDLLDYLPRTKPLLDDIMKCVDRLLARHHADQGCEIGFSDCFYLKQYVPKFEHILEDELSYLDIFLVLPKGIYDTKKLLQSVDERFSEQVRRWLPEQTIYDFQEAGKCLAFECPTAAVFHTLRGTEALMLAYYTALAGKPWPFVKNKEWKAYIDHLVKEGAPQSITQRLNEIREFERNPIIHPDHNVRLDRALPLFEMIGGVVVLMAEEIGKLEAAKAPSKS